MDNMIQKSSNTKQRNNPVCSCIYAEPQEHTQAQCNILGGSTDSLGCLVTAPTEQNRDTDLVFLQFLPDSSDHVLELITAVKSQQKT